MSGRSNESAKRLLFTYSENLHLNNTYQKQISDLTRKACLSARPAEVVSGLSVSSLKLEKRINWSRQVYYSTSRLTADDAEVSQKSCPPFCRTPLL